MDNYNTNCLFLYSSSSSINDAYSLRLDKFKQHLFSQGVTIGSLYLKDYLMVPSIIQPLSIPLFFNKLKAYDLIHAGNTSCAYWMSLNNYFSNTKFIYDVHGDVVQECMLNFNRFNLKDNFKVVQSRFMEMFASRSKYLIVCSGPLKQHYINKGIDKDQIEIIRNGVDIELFRPYEHIDELDNFTVTYAGAFQKWQGIESLLEAARIVDSDIFFKIIGFKSTDAALKKQIEKEFGTKVQLIDSVPRKNLAEQLSLSSVLIIPRKDHPAINAAFPTKFAEYLAIGKPIIVTRVDETANFVEKYDCGFTCSPTPESIAQTIEMAKNTPSQILSKKGANARKLAEKEFDQTIINKKYYDFMSKIFVE